MAEDFAALGDRASREIRLRSTKWNGAPYFTWTCRLVAASPEALVIAQPAGTSIETMDEARRAADELSALIARCEFPFNALSV